MGAVENAIKIDVDLRLPVFWLRRDKSAIDAHAGIVEQQIETAETLTHLVEQRRDLRAVTHIGGDRHRCVAEFFGECPDAVPAAGDKNHLHAFGGEQARRRFADAAGCAGDDRDLAG